MEKAKISRLLLLLVFLVSTLSVSGMPGMSIPGMSIPGMSGMPGMQTGPAPPYAPRPLCQSQFILVNYACATLPYNPAPLVPPPGEPSDPPPSPDDGDTPDSPASPPPVGQEHRRIRHKQHRLHRLRTETPVEATCCRWLKAVDTECVCDLLVHLPTFLSRPVHQYTVTINEDCDVTFSCASRLSA